MASDLNVVLESLLMTSGSRQMNRLNTYLTHLVSRPDKEVLNELSKVSIESNKKG